MLHRIALWAVLVAVFSLACMSYSSVYALEKTLLKAIKEIPMLRDSWTAKLGDNGTRLVEVVTYRSEAATEAEWVTLHNTRVAARAAACPPIN